MSKRTHGFEFRLNDSKKICWKTKAVNISIALLEDIKEIKSKLNAIYRLIKEDL